MNQAERKAWIVERIRSSDFENIHEAWAVVGDNKLTGPASVEALLQAVMEIPDAIA